MESLDFLAIGDIVSEPFIKLVNGLKEENVVCEHGEEDCKLCLAYGDKIPYDYFVFVPAVGNASNAAVAASRLGLKSALHAYVGDDAYGKECLDVLQQENVGTDYMVTEVGKKTNYHYVLWFGSDRTILVKHEEFTYTVPELTSSPKWVYL